jgi:hypothetical protein
LRGLSAVGGAVVTHLRRPLPIRFEGRKRFLTILSCALVDAQLRRLPKLAADRRGSASAGQRFGVPDQRSLPDHPAQQPREPVRRPSEHGEEAAVDAPQVMEGAQADLVLGVVAATVRAEVDVVRVDGAVAAPRDLAKALIPVADLL